MSEGSDTRASRVLLVEDNPGEARLVRETLAAREPGPFEITHCTCLRDALESLARGSIDVVLLDLGLPDSQGLETCRRIHRAAPLIPIVVLTHQDDVGLEAIRAGATDYLSKQQAAGALLSRALRFAIERQALVRRLLETTRAAESSDSNFKNLINENADAMLVLDQDGVIRFANPSAVMLFRRSETELVREQFGHALARDETSEIEIIRPGAEAVLAEMRVVEVKWDDTRAYLACIRDITERERAVAKLGSLAHTLRAQNHALTRSNEALNEFAYVASHDLKEPLRGIHNYASFLLEDYSERLDEAGRAKLETLTRLTLRMETLIDSLLYYSRVGQTELGLGRVSLQDVVEEVVESLHISLEEADVEVRIPAELPTLVCDQGRIAEVFHNLITNAIKYNDTPEKWIEIGSRQEAEGCVLYVRDNGIGIPEKHQGAVFRIFKRLHGRDAYGGGTGFGLTIVKKIVERHAGRIWVESSLGEGTTFCFTLGDAKDDGKALDDQPAALGHEPAPIAGA